MFDASRLRPMLATLPASDPPLVDPSLVYEPKYDGIRAIVLVEPGPPPRVRLWSRLGNEKTRQFPEIVDALVRWASRVKGVVVLDGEVVALDAAGKPAGFQQLQTRIHVKTPTYRSSAPQLSPAEQPTAFVAFDLLRHADIDYRTQPLTDRRRALETLFARHRPEAGRVWISEQVAGDGRALYEQARREGWEGLLVKAARGPYRDGRRTPEWRKLKIVQQDEFVVGGFTEPRGTRVHFGSLVLGSYQHGALVHVGDVGTGFDGATLQKLWRLLKPTATDRCPFAVRPKTIGKAHWVEPTLVVQVRFSEWTHDGRLRHPAYLGLRDDKAPREVTSAPPASAVSRPAAAAKAATAAPAKPGKAPANTAPKATSTDADASTRKTAAARPRKAAKRPTLKGSTGALAAWQPQAEALVAQLDDLESRRKGGRLVLPDGQTLDITNPHKVFWPEVKGTKADLFRYYARVAPLLLPVIADRPLVMKRFPNGVEGEAFYQHRAPEPVPDGIRIETLPDDDVPARLIGGDLKTLLYMAQIAAISMDPFFSRVGSLAEADQAAIDLDPQPGCTFATILKVARWVHEELDALGVVGHPKTSGSEGLHVFIPLQPGTTYEQGMLFCQIVATIVATKHPKEATVERAVRKRKPGTVYVDYLQNIEGKTLACAYSARASGFGGVSAPLTWDEVYGSPTPQDFTVTTMAARLAKVGDLWAPLRQSKGIDLTRALAKLR